KSKANTLINEAQKRAVVIAGQIGFNNQTPNLSEFSPYDKGVFDSSHVYYEADGLSKQFGIKILDVKKSVCQNILNTIGEKTPIRRISKENTLKSPIKNCDEAGNYILIYNNDMTANSDTEYCKTNTDCGECGTCQIADGEEVGICVGECDTACQEGDTCGENDCVGCDSETKTCQNKCVEVEYLESNGTQCIDTGVVGKSGLETDIDMEWVVVPLDGTFLGARKKDIRIYPLHYFNNNWTLGYNKYTNTGGLAETNKKYHIHTVLEAGTQTLSVDGTTVINQSDGSSYDTGLNMYIFALNYDGSVEYPVKAKAYKIVIKKNGSLVRDFIPVLSPIESEYEGKPCLFDKVSKKLFCDENGGTFDYGA
ncbi:MAG: hypothetical protein ACI4OR_02260, partial [Alphaproteobacteria bacterium]